MSCRMRWSLLVLVAVAVATSQPVRADESQPGDETLQINNDEQPGNEIPAVEEADDEELSEEVTPDENGGQADFDEAMATKLTASSLADLDRVVRLLDTALDKGLDADNVKFAKKLLASALIQRGTGRGMATIKSLRASSGWRELRRLALLDLDRGLEFEPTHIETLYMVVRLNLLPNGDHERAVTLLDRAIKAEAADPRLAAGLLRLRAIVETDPKKKIVDLDAALQLVPDDATALRTRAMARANLGELEQALEDFNRSIKSDPKHAPSYEAKAFLLAKLNRFDEALACLDKVAELTPPGPAAALPLIQKARIHLAQKNDEAAIAALTQARLIDGRNLAVLLLRASIYEQRKEYKKALADLEEALKLRPGLPAALQLRAMLWATTGQVDKAIEAMESLEKANPKDLLLKLQLGMLYTSSHESAKAIEAYTTVLAEHPGNVAALRGRGDAYLGVGKCREAIADYEVALKLEPKDPGLLNNFAWVLATSPDASFRNGKRAIELATQACELTEYKLAHILSTLAAAYAELGDFAAAEQWCVKGIAASKGNEKEALEKELIYYKAEKPWREDTTNAQDEGSDESDKATDEPEDESSDGSDKDSADNGAEDRADDESDKDVADNGAEQDTL